MYDLYNYFISYLFVILSIWGWPSHQSMCSPTPPLPSLPPPSCSAEAICSWSFKCLVEGAVMEWWMGERGSFPTVRVNFLYLLIEMSQSSAVLYMLYHDETLLPQFLRKCLLVCYSKGDNSGKYLIWSGKYLISDSCFTIMMMMIWWWW